AHAPRRSPLDARPARDAHPLAPDAPGRRSDATRARRSVGDRLEAPLLPERGPGPRVPARARVPPRPRRRPRAPLGAARALRAVPRALSAGTPAARRAPPVLHRGPLLACVWTVRRPRDPAR